MSSVATTTTAVQVVPGLLTADKFARSLATTMGRDKFLKIIHYGCKIAAAIGESPSAPSFVQRNKSDLLQRATALEGGVGGARKVMRFFRFVPGYIAVLDFVFKYAPYIAAALNRRKSRRPQKSAAADGAAPAAAAAVAAPVAALPPLNAEAVAVDFIKVASQFFLATYFLFDHLNWFAKTKVMSNRALVAPKPAAAAVAPAGKSAPAAAAAAKPFEAPNLIARTFNNNRLDQYNVWSSYSWAASVVLSLIADGHALAQTYIKERPLQQQALALATRRLKGEQVDDKTEQDVNAKLKQLNDQRMDLLLTMTANGCDFFIAMSLTGVMNVSKMSQGILGVINGAIGLYKVWPAK